MKDLSRHLEATLTFSDGTSCTVTVDFPHHACDAHWKWSGTIPTAMKEIVRLTSRRNSHPGGGFPSFITKSFKLPPGSRVEVKPFEPWPRTCFDDPRAEQSR